MRKVYCDMCGNELNEDEILRKDGQLWTEGFSDITLTKFKDVCEKCSYRCENAVKLEVKKIKEEVKNGKEEFENPEEFEIVGDETEKCVHCGESLARMMINVEHITRAGKYCSKECYDAGCKDKDKKENKPPCIICGKLIDRSKKWNCIDEYGIYCSEECWDARKKES